MVLPSIAQLASKHGIHPLKKFGQNFIFDQTLCDKIVKSSCLQPDEVALEIGPGPAGLTRSILKAQPSQLIVIETDNRCIPLLEEIRSHYPALKIIQNDALRIRVSELLDNKRVRIIANLPYNIGTLLLLNWFEELEYIDSMTLMLQKEVVDRIVAKPGTKAYGRLSVIAQILCDCQKSFDVSPKAFYPAPKVWSSIVQIKPKESRPANNIINNIEKVTSLAFSGRRKMIKSSLKQLSSNIDELLSKCSINPELRAENLTITDYLNIATLLTQI